MTSIEQWEDFLSFNTLENVGETYTFSTDIDFLLIYPTGCPALDIYVVVDGGGTTWKNFFIFGQTFNFTNGVCNLNFVNMFAHATHLLKWDKFIENVTMSVSMAGNMNSLFYCADVYGNTRINNCFFNIYGFYTYFTLDNRSNMGDSNRAEGIISNCVFKFDADITSARFTGANCVNVVLLGRLHTISDQGYIQTRLYFSRHYKKIDDDTYELALPAYSAIYNLYLSNFDVARLSPSGYLYYPPIIYNSDLAPFYVLISGTEPETIPEGVTTKVPVKGKYVTGTLKPDDVPIWKWYCVPEAKNPTTSQWSYDTYRVIEENGVKHWHLQWEHTGYGLNMGGLTPYSTESIANGDCLEVDYGLTLPDWVISSTYNCPMPEKLTVSESISGAFRNTKIKSIVLPKDCKYCENSFPPGCAITGGTLAEYLPKNYT